MSSQPVFLYTGQSREEIPRDVRHVRVHSLVARIKDYAFEGCEWLVNVELNPGLKFIGNGAFSKCTCLTKIAIPDTVTYIGAVAFFRCESLVEVVLSRRLRYLGERTFAQCQVLTAVAIPSSVGSIGYRTFAQCYSLADVKLEEGLVRIGVCAFKYCKALTAISIPSTVVVISKLAFAHCGLIGVEILYRGEELGNSYCPNSFLHCDALVNVSTPKRMRFWSKWRNRYAGSLVHEACYYGSVSTLEDLREALSLSDSNKMTDAFGMTPFHVVATSAHLRADMLEVLLDHYPLATLSFQDKDGKTAMNYLVKHRSPSAVPLIQMILKRTIQHKLQGAAFDKWRVFLKACLDLIRPEIGFQSRTQRISEVVKLVTQCQWREITSPVELAAWKMAIRKKKARKEISKDYRRDCRFSCQAEIVLQHVLGYLLNGGNKAVCWAL